MFTNKIWTHSNYHNNSYVENNKLFKWHKIQELIFGDLKYYSFVNKQESKPKTQNGKQ
jgi:hypothetical protein